MVETNFVGEDITKVRRQQFEVSVRINEAHFVEYAKVLRPPTSTVFWHYCCCCCISAALCCLLLVLRKTSRPSPVFGSFYVSPLRTTVTSRKLRGDNALRWVSRKRSPELVQRRIPPTSGRWGVSPAADAGYPVVWSQIVRYAARQRIFFCYVHWVTKKFSSEIK